MKKIFILILLVSMLFSSEKQEDLNYKIVPTLTSNPTSGTGLGLIGMLLYNADENSSTSQLFGGGQYTNTDSYNFFAGNAMFFKGDKWQSKTIFSHFFNKSSFDIPVGDFTYSFADSYSSADMDVKGYFIAQKVLYKVYTNIYIGAQAIFYNTNFNATNELGKLFMKEKGIEDNKLGSVGISFSYDNRRKNEIIYPRDAQLIDIMLNTSPTSLGANESYSNFSINARHYQRGFKADDVLALQLFFMHVSENAPDNALPTVGMRNIIRGFSLGQYKARTMSAAQAEYRYQITNTRFRLALFGGYTNLSNGSKGNEYGNRDADNGDYFSGGIGLRYTLDKKSGMDYRIDLVTTNKDEQSIYASIKQAF